MPTCFDLSFLRFFFFVGFDASLSDSDEISMPLSDSSLISSSSVSFGSSIFQKNIINTFYVLLVLPECPNAQVACRPFHFSSCSPHSSPSPNESNQSVCPSARQRAVDECAVFVPLLCSLFSSHFCHHRRREHPKWSRLLYISMVLFSRFCLFFRVDDWF